VRNKVTIFRNRTLLMIILNESFADFLFKIYFYNSVVGKVGTSQHYNNDFSVKEQQVEKKIKMPFSESVLS